MNSNLLKLAQETDVWCDQNHFGSEFYHVRWEEKFAELIIQECIKQAHSVGELRGVTDDMTFGADTAALKISKHFGVE